MPQQTPVAPQGSGVFAEPTGPEAEAVATPQAPDPAYYLAHELDSYPWPAAPLDFDHLAGGVAGAAVARFKLRLLIDERGVVNEVAAVEGAPAGTLEERIRASVAATPFVPGRRDGRAVKSRILLSVTLGDPLQAEARSNR